MLDADEDDEVVGELRQQTAPRSESDIAGIPDSAQSQETIVVSAAADESRPTETALVQDNDTQERSGSRSSGASALEELLKSQASPMERGRSAPDGEPSTSNLLDLFEQELPRDRRTSFSPMAAEDHITESLPASLSTALTQARMARATASAERAERASGSRSTSKDSVLTDRSLAPPDRISTRAKDMFKKGVMSSMSSVTSQAGARSSASVRAFPREQLKRISDEIKEMREKYEAMFVEKMEFFSVADRVARIEVSLQEQLGKGGNLINALKALRTESRQHQEGHDEVLGKLAEINAATVDNTARLRDEQHRVENAADHAFRTAKNLEQVSSNLTVTREALGEDVARMAKAVQALATEVKAIDEEHRSFLSQQENERAKMEGGDGYKGWFAKMKQQMQDQEYLHSVLVRDLQYVKQQFDSCATEADLRKVQEKLQDVQEENGRLQEFVHEKFFEVQDQERREMMDKFAAKWDPYNKGRLLRATVDNWASFVKHLNKTREALRRVKHVYAKTHVTARLRSWWYLMQRDHTDSQFRSLSENLETQEAKLEGARGALLRHEKVTAEQSRSLQYRVLAVEKGLEAAERDKATKEEMLEKFGSIEDRLQKELSLEPIRQVLDELRADVRQLQAQKVDEADAALDRERVGTLCSEFRAWLVRHDESLKRKAEITANDTKADAELVEQVLVLMAKQADQLATMVSSDVDQLRQALTRFLEISPDFRKASLSIGMEPQEQCVACRALPRKFVSDGATGADGSVYKMGTDTVLSASEQTQKVLADKLRFPLSLSSSLFVGCTGPTATSDATPVSAIQPLPLLRQMVVAESGWLTAKESAREPERALQRKLVQSQEMPVQAVTPRSKRRPPSAQEELRDRPQSVRSYFPAVDVRGSIPSGRRSR